MYYFRGHKKLFKLFPLLATVLLGRLGVLVLAQDNGTTDTSCVQADNVTFTRSCPCGVATLSFDMVGATSVVDNVASTSSLALHTVLRQVNIALVLDGSGSVGTANFLIEREFAKNVTAAFAARNLFSNGGTALYVQFSSTVDPTNTGTFVSLDEFNDFVDGNAFGGGGTNIGLGISKANQLLNAAPPASAAFMFVITDGISSIGSEPDDARADDITLFAIGVGSSVDENVLLAVAGSEDNVFSADTFEDLEAAVDEIFESDGTSTIPCPATNITLVVEYGATVDSVVSGPDATVSGDTVTFVVSNLEDNPTTFTVIVDTCGAADPVDPVVSITYSDDQGNSPDFGLVLEAGNSITCPPATSPPTFSPTPSPTFGPTPVIKTPDTCSNGVTGVGGSGQCCVLECDKCYDSGCKKRAAKADLTAKDCCPDRISKSGPYCEDVGYASCIVNKPKKSSHGHKKNGHKGKDGY